MKTIQLRIGSRIQGQLQQDLKLPVPGQGQAAAAEIKDEKQPLAAAMSRALTLVT